MVEFREIEKEFEELERNDEWEEIFRFNYYSSGDSEIESTLEVAKHSMNEKYNRYRNILPYDHSRIKLKECLETDYINANLVENKFIDRKYILTQGPLRSTCEHFWQMIWEQNTKGIVMLNRLYENGKPKCEMYFPNLDEDNSEMTLTFGKFRLNYISEQPGIDYSIRVIECENLEQKETREIYHFHFTNWPDFGEPETTSSFLKFLNECKNRNIFDSKIYGPPVIHCSAGVGRSGTFILVDLLLELLSTSENKSPCSIAELLDELRKYRMGLVQTHTQYKFAFKAIIDGMRQRIGDDSSSAEVLDTEGITLEDKLENLSDENEYDDSDSDSDDEYYENSNNNATVSRRRPDTAFKGNKKFKASKQNQNRIKNLRSMQEQNRIKNSDDSENTAYGDKNRPGYETTKPMDLRLNLDFLNDNKLSNAKNLGEKSSDEDDNDDSETDENPFSTDRNISTVKVNKPRKPIEQILNEPSQSKSDVDAENGHMIQRKVPTSTNKQTPNPNLSQTTEGKTLSARDQRIAEKIKEIKKKQIEHEQSKELMSQLKPFLIGGGLLIGGLLIFEICKKNFFH